ncbi:polysaccharide deacetylase family protein [Paenibacillus ginsengarvi]|uniref:Polysaccharide deacetylase family protein n=1 Tax=Paenibacillus ginsengarvi TaxID=400777 RepID=A0A3B0CKV6_9BACL|nr:polysaccharide deacetylase family protein [Paenibacillus ginsengarvi]RKN85481.1 polysaccharide deacetylase family protein [Paenibacillus ginsengarvi]
MKKSTITALLLLLIGITLLLPSLNATRGGAYYSDQVAVLMYHHIHDTDESSSTITSALFEQQLTYMRDKGYQFISLAEFENFMKGGAVPDNAVFVTFDDGYESFYSHAYPILGKFGVPATVFVITDKQDNPQEYQPPYMTPVQVWEMTSARPGIISAQCHTHGMHNDPVTPYMTHRLVIDGAKETEEQYRSRIAADTAACIERMTPLGPEPINALAYPYGVYDRTSAELLKEAGIDFAFTIVPEMATRSRNPLQIPRINAGSPNISPERLHQTILRRIVANPKAAS